MSDRIQREIEEILQQAGEPAPPEPRPKPRRRPFQGIRGRQVRFDRYLLRPSSGKLFLLSVLLLVGALIVRTAGPGSVGSLVGVLAWAGIVLFIAAYALFFIGPRNTTEKRWRGRPIDEPPREDDFRDRLRRWWRR